MKAAIAGLSSAKDKTGKQEKTIPEE